MRFTRVIEVDLTVRLKIGGDYWGDDSTFGEAIKQCRNQAIQKLAAILKREGSDETIQVLCSSARARIHFYEEAEKG